VSWRGLPVARYTGSVPVNTARFELLDPRRTVEHRDSSQFDRIAFAMRALQRLRPKRMKVAVYSAVSSLHVEQGRDLGRPEGSTWAIVGIPPHASREHIAYALVELAGVASVPYAVQMLLADETIS
jgi:hypothetical protein